MGGQTVPLIINLPQSVGETVSNYDGNGSTSLAGTRQTILRLPMLVPTSEVPDNHIPWADSYWPKIASTFQLPLEKISRRERLDQLLRRRHRLTLSFFHNVNPLPTCAFAHVSKVSTNWRRLRITAAGVITITTL